MIFLSPSLILETPDINLDNPVIGWRNVTTIGGLSSDSADPNFPVSNLANPSTALLWKSETLDDQSVQVTFDETLIDYVAVARHNFGAANLTVTVEGASEINSDGELEWFELAPDVSLVDDAPILFRFTPHTLVGVRLRLDNAVVEPQAAVLYVGQLLVLQRRINVGHTPLTHGVVSKAITARSESGQFLGRVVVSETAESSVTMLHLTPNWYRGHMTPFVEAAREAPFFFAWRPGSYPLEVGYAWLLNDPQMSNQLPNGMVQVELAMGGIVT